MVFNPQTSSGDAVPGIKQECHFFPEGGHMIYNLDNVVAFSLPGISLKTRLRGTVIDSSGREITRVAIDTSGTGLFHIIPRKGDRYRLRIPVDSNQIYDYPLPEAMDDGITIHISSGEGEKKFTISKDKKNPVDSVQVKALMFGREVAEIGLDLRNETLVTGAFRTEMLPNGRMQIIVCSPQGNLLALRNTYILHEQSFPVELITDTLSFSPRSLNTFHLSFPDSVFGDFSLSVTPLVNKDLRETGGNIRSDLFLRSGLKEPARGLNDPSAEDERELQMLTHDWEIDSFSEGQRYIDENYIHISGRIATPMKEFNNPPSEISFIVSTKDSAQSLLAVPVDSSGRFNIPDLVFSDTAQFYYQLQGKKPITKNVQVNLDDADVLAMKDLSFSSEKEYLAGIETEMKTMVEEKEFLSSVRRTYDLQKIKDAAGLMLEEVTVRSKKVKPVVAVNKQYTSGIFSTMSNVRTLDLVNNPDPAGNQNIFDYLKGKISGLIVGRNSSGYYIESGRSLSSLDVIQGGNGLVDGLIYLNEMPVTADVVANISVNQVALVKFFPPGSLMALPGVGVSCVLAIYTKEGEAIRDNRIYMGMFKYPGYSPVKEFVVPDYSVEKKDIRDPRRTLYWAPDIYMQGEKSIPIRFYNATMENGYRVILEGVTREGRLVHYEAELPIGASK
jgi:hypothetical protein